MVSGAVLSTACDAALQEVQVVVRDVAEPRVLALPHYRGEIYIFLAIVSGGIFALTMAPVLLISCIISVSTSACCCLLHACKAVYCPAQVPCTACHLLALQTCSRRHGFCILCQLRAYCVH
jgi:hypothetical protein